MYYLSVYLFVSFSLGIISSIYFPLSFDFLIYLLPIFVLLSLFLRNIYSLIFLIITFFLFGAFLSINEYKKRFAYDISNEKLQHYAYIECVVDSIPRTYFDGSQKFLCEVINSDNSKLEKKLLTVFLSKEIEKFSYHAHIAFIGKISLYNKRLYAYPIENFVLVRDNSSIFSFVERFKNFLKENYSIKTISQDTYSLGIAISFGDKSFLENSTRESFIKTGLIHLLVISGMHVAILVFVLNTIFFFLPRKVKNIVIILAILFYSVLTGLNIPVIRASTMAILYILADFFYFKVDSLLLLFWVALGFLIFSPFSLFSPSFQLSFSATLGILLFVRYVPISDNYFIKYILYPTFISFIAVIFVSPILMYHFGGISLSGVLYTPIYLPIIYIYVFSSFVNVITGFEISLLVKLMDSIGFLFLKSVDYLQHFSFYIKSLEFNWIFVVLFYVLVLIIILFIRSFLFKFVFLFISFVFFLALSKERSDKWEFYFFPRRYSSEFFVVTPYKECFFSFNRDSSRIHRLLKKKFCLKETFFKDSCYYNDLKIIRLKKGFLIKSNFFKFYLKGKPLEFKIFSKEIN